VSSDSALFIDYFIFSQTEDTASFETVIRELASFSLLLSWACLYNSSKRYLFFWILPGSFLLITAEFALLRLMAEVGF
jgi:hypothetical protein